MGSDRSEIMSQIISTTSKRRIVAAFMAAGCALLLALMPASPGSAQRGSGGVSPWTFGEAPNYVPKGDIGALTVISGYGQICPEGTVRPGFQMYVSLLKNGSGEVTVYAMTNKGTVYQNLFLPADVRMTVDMNSLVAPGGPFAGQPDVDVAVLAVSTTDDLFMACPLYFNSSIGSAGGVSGGHVQMGVPVLV
jgi:hypothetical protein